MTTRPIVVGVDGSGRSLRALEWAAHSAVLHDCPLKIVHVLPRWVEDVPFFPPGRFEEAGKRGRRIVAEAADIVAENYPDLEVGSAFPYGMAPAKALLIEAEHARALVLGAKGDGLGNLPLGSVSFQVAGHAASPVVIVNHIVARNNRVTVGTDLSQRSTPALEYAIETAALRGAELQVLHTWSMPYPAEPPDPMKPDPSEIADRHRDELDEQIGALCKRYPEVEVTVRLPLRTSPIPALTHASDRSDLLVLGSRGRGGFHGLALGSVSHHLLHYSACPVAIVRPPHDAP